MSVAVTRQRTPEMKGLSLRFPRAAGEPGLVSECLLGAGVSVRVDATDLSLWQSIQVDQWDPQSRQLLDCLIGAQAVSQLQERWPSAEANPDLDWLELDFDPPGHWDGRVESEPDWSAGRRASPGLDAPVVLDRAGPWLRVAAADALNRWLHLPFEQCLMDAERAVARAAAAGSLRPGQARDEVLAHAFRLARAASWGVVTYLGGLPARADVVPAGLSKALGELIEGYRSLAAELKARTGERDPQFDAVVRAGRRVLERLPIAAVARFSGGSPATSRASGLLRAPADLVSRVDLRRLSARTVSLSGDPQAGEVEGRVIEGGALQVEVPAYAPCLGHLRDSGAGDGLLVTLLDRHSGAEHDAALLTLEPENPGTPAAGRWVFRAVLDLDGADPGALRADVLDTSLGDLDAPVAVSDADPDLLAVRQQVMALAAVRRRLAEHRLGLWAGDPQPETLHGPGDLLVAEVAAALSEPVR